MRGLIMHEERQFRQKFVAGPMRVKL